jgi:hypothetical protein
MICATAEVFVRHCNHHAEGPLVALGLTLWKNVELGNFGGGEKHDGCIRTRGDAGSAADACSRVKSDQRLASAEHFSGCRERGSADGPLGAGAVQRFRQMDKQARAQTFHG